MWCVCMFLSAVSHVLYGERLGVLLDYIDPDAQHFIDCITLMFKTTSPMLYLPPALLRHTGAKVWKDHVEAWDGIFNQGNTTLLMKLMLGVLAGKNTSTDFSSLNVVFQSRPMYPEYLQTAEEKSRCWWEVPWCAGQPPNAGQTVHRRHKGQHHGADGRWRGHGTRNNQR